MTILREAVKQTNKTSDAPSENCQISYLHKCKWEKWKTKHYPDAKNHKICPQIPEFNLSNALHATKVKRSRITEVNKHSQKIRNSKSNKMNKEEEMEIGKRRRRTTTRTRLRQVNRNKIEKNTCKKLAMVSTVAVLLIPTS